MKLSYFFFASFVLVTFANFAASVCPTGYQEFQSRCFRALIDTPSIWRKATSACEESGGHLAFVDDCKLMHDLFNYLTNVDYSKSYWIGASDSGENGEWEWINGNEVEMGVPFWGTTTPNWQIEPSGDYSSNCAILSKDDQYYMHDENCFDASFYPLCEAASTELQSKKEEEKTENENIKIEALECPDDFIEIDNSCFYFHYDSRDDSTLVTNSDAKSICTDKGGRLATLENCALFGRVVAHINSDPSIQLPQGASYWIGASYRSNVKEWTWDATGIELNIGCPFWGSSNGKSEPSDDETSEQCALLYADNQYYVHDGECFKLAYPLCRALKK